MSETDVGATSHLFVFLALATTDGGTPAGSQSEPAADLEQTCRGGGHREGAGSSLPAHWGFQPFAQGYLVGVLNVS